MNPMKRKLPENPPLLISPTSKRCGGSVSSHQSNVVETSPHELPVVHGTTDASLCSQFRAFTRPLSSASAFLAGVVIKNNSLLTPGISTRYKSHSGSMTTASTPSVLKYRT